jgi:hypothetical protein
VEAGDGDLATAPVDADVDGAANFRDNDSDNDLILDASEGVFDRDMDGLANFVDTDSDADGVLDRDEAGDADLMTSPVNSDTDTTPNYLDTDSDDDGLADGAEAGCPAGSSRLLADSDGDTFLDPAELAFGSNPCNMGSVITGFPFFDTHHDHHNHDPDLERFLNNGEPPIIFARGTTAVHIRSPFYEHAIGACTALNRRGVLLVGRDDYRSHLPKLPSTIYAATYAPFSELLPRGCAIVHHGGIGSTAQGLRSMRADGQHL